MCFCFCFANVGSYCSESFCGSNILGPQTGSLPGDDLEHNTTAKNAARQAQLSLSLRPVYYIDQAAIANVSGNGILTIMLLINPILTKVDQKKTKKMVALNKISGNLSTGRHKLEVPLKLNPMKKCGQMQLQLHLIRYCNTSLAAQMNTVDGPSNREDETFTSC